MLKENVQKSMPESHSALDRFASGICYVKLNTDLKKRNAGTENSEQEKKKPQTILNAIDLAVENKIKILTGIISKSTTQINNACTPRNMTVPMVFWPPIPNNLLTQVDEHLKSKGHNYNRDVAITVTFKREQFEHKASII